MIGLYIRISTLGQEDGYSIPTQIQRGIEFATSLNEDYQIYQETKSGSSMENRTQLQRMLDDIKAGLITKVWVVESSRLTRDLSDAVTIQKIFKEFNISLYVNSVLTDFSSPERLLQYHITSAVSQYERAQIVARSVRGKNEWADQGRTAFSSIYGYKYRYSETGKKEWYIVDIEKDVITKIFNWYLNENKSYNQIMQLLNDSGYVTKDGKKWARGQVSQVLTKSAYCGKVKNTKGELIPSLVYEPIIQEETFNKTQDRLKLLKNNRKKNQWTVASNEMTGLIKCAYCGSAYYLSRKRRKDSKYLVYYHSTAYGEYAKCPQTVKHLTNEGVNNFFNNLVNDEFIENSETLHKWYHDLKSVSLQNREQLEVEVKSSSEQLQKLIERKTKIIDLITDGTITKQDAKNNIAKLNKEITLLDNNLTKKREVLRNMVKTKEDENYNAIVNLSLNYDKLSVIEKREFFKLVFKEITLDGNKILVKMYNGELRKRLIK